MMSSKVRAPGKNAPCFARNSETSGSAPPMRWRMRSLRSRTISRFAARSSGRIERIASDMPLTYWSSICCWSRWTSSSKRWRASGSRKSYSRSPPIRSPMSSGRASSWSSRFAATSRSIRRRPGSAAGSEAAGSPPGARVSRVASPAGGGLGGVEPALHAGPLLRDDLVELAADVAEDVAQPVALEHRLAPPLEPVHQVAQPREVAARRVARPPAALHQPAQGLGQVALGHDVVGHRVEDLVRVEVGDLLAAVPAREPGLPGEGDLGGAARRRGGWRGRAGARPQVGGVRGEGGHRRRGSGHRW